MEFRIEPASPLPIYRQLRNQFRQAVARGDLRPGERLPSVRELSRKLVVNPNTIARVYTELEREGLLNTRPGLGVFVAEPRHELTKEVRTERFVELLDGFLTEAVHLGFSQNDVLSAISDRVGQFAWQA
ncbi:MAG: GntR family transcriptional regulator [Pirellulales bacterium]|nr:GntR family transcriptional regulator [Pirellulales bacterium]